LDHPEKAYLSRYALGRDYHKVLRARLKALSQKIEARVGPHGHRVFVDSAPVLEKPLAEKAGLGWIGKHPDRGSSWANFIRIFSCRRMNRQVDTAAPVAPASTFALPMPLLLLTNLMHVDAFHT
jgi:epoxyqueuosine reductase